MAIFNYFTFLAEGIERSSGDAWEDGHTLMQRCLGAYDAHISNSEQFPIKLLILLASPDYAKPAIAEQLLAGIYDTLQKHTNEPINLIGCTVAAVFFGQRIHDQGALLICLAGRMLDVVTAVDETIRSDTEAAANQLLAKLGLDFSGQEHDPNPLVNRLLLTFFAGYEDERGGKPYPGQQFHKELRKGMRARVPIVGGGSTAYNRRTGGLQFLNRSIYTDAAVCASLTTGFPFTSSISDGLKGTGQLFHVSRASIDEQTIYKFKEGTPTDVLELHEPNDFAVLGRYSLDDDPANHVARILPTEPGAVRLRRAAGKHTVFEKLAPCKEKMRKSAKDSFEKSLLRLRVENPVGCLGIHCAARRETDLEIAQITADIELSLRNGGRYVGGFFDGEIGIGQTGRSLYDNWCAVTLCFGDEMRERTPYLRGFKEMSRYADRLAHDVISSHQQLADRLTEFDRGLQLSLNLIFETGYPGAMISLVLENGGNKWIVARAAKGTRMETIGQTFRRPFVEGQLFDQIAKGQHPRLILNANDSSVQTTLGVEGTQLTSLYIVPLRALNREVIGFLHIDLGDIRYKTIGRANNSAAWERIYAECNRGLDPLGAVIESNVARLISRKEIQINHDLAEALKNNLSSPNRGVAVQNFLEAAVKSFGADMGHIRLLQDEGNNQVLVLVAGTGAYYEAMRTVRTRLLLTDDSPTCLAFRRSRIQRNSQWLVINEAQGDEDFQRLCSQYPIDSPIRRALNQVGSCADVVFRNEQGEPIGMINLVSARPWIFTRARMSLLEAMGTRLNLLLAHIERQQNLHFLAQVGTDYVHNANFKDQLQTLTDATERFRQAANADQAGLFIWNYETERFILRAQSRWADSNWVDAARYRKGERWTGSVAIAAERQYLPDLFLYKQSQQEDPNRHYAKYVFGHELSPDFTVEALGLPLKLKRRSVGVLVLYRHVRPEEVGRGMSFTTIDKKILQEAANNLAAMINAQLHYLRVKWERRETRRHALVHQAMETPRNFTQLEDTICKQVLEHFHASKTRLYLLSPENAENGLQWASGYTQIPRRMRLSPELPDELVAWAGHTLKLESDLYPATEPNWNDPECAKLEGMPRRVCVPLTEAQRLVGVLDIEWDLQRIFNSKTAKNRGKLNAPEREIQSPHKSRWLKRLGQEIGVTYARRQRALQQSDQLQAEIRAARSRDAVQTIGAMLFQSAHRVNNLLQDFEAISHLLITAKNEAQREHRLEQLTALLATAAQQISRPLEVGRRIQKITPSQCRLLSLLRQVEAEQHFKPNIEIFLNIPPELTIWADCELMHEAFQNIVRNALQMMPDGGHLQIEASPSIDASTITLSFADTGPGMSRKELADARAGFHSTTGGTGYGIVVTELLVRANNGTYEITSRPGAGTKVTVTLPATAGVKEGI